MLSAIRPRRPGPARAVLHVHFCRMSKRKELACLQNGNGQSHVNLTTVSVIITSYNHGKFLAEAIETVCAQSHRAAEIIVVDDGSTDNTHDIACRHQGVRYLRQNNS